MARPNQMAYSFKKALIVRKKTSCPVWGKNPRIEGQILFKLQVSSSFLNFYFNTSYTYAQNSVN